LHDPVVSSDDDLLIVVDEDDRAVGHLDKRACHDGEGVLHRAFSVFIFNRRGELLLQRRADEKRLWPGFWSNSCCSHPRRGERLEEAAARRLEEELGIAAELVYLYTFRYHARYSDAGSEREVCSVFVGRSDGPVRANRREIAEWRWIAPADLEAELARDPEAFTPWMKLEWPEVKAARGAAPGTGSR
jgi:isopentenyl-diphosphate delta-isomerase